MDSFQFIYINRKCFHSPVNFATSGVHLSEILPENRKSTPLYINDSIKITQQHPTHRFCGFHRKSWGVGRLWTVWSPKSTPLCFLWRFFRHFCIPVAYFLIALYSNIHPCAVLSGVSLLPKGGETYLIVENLCSSVENWDTNFHTYISFGE